MMRTTTITTSATTPSDHRSVSAAISTPGARSDECPRDPENPECRFADSGHRKAGNGHRLIDKNNQRRSDDDR